MSGDVETIEEKAERYEKTLRAIAGCALTGVDFGEWVQAACEDALEGLYPECWHCGTYVHDGPCADADEEEKGNGGGGMMALTVENAMDYLYDHATDGVAGGLHSACKHVLRDERFAWAPGSKGKHHAFRGGLALHTAEVVRNCLLLGQNLDWPVLLTAAIWHDYMKVKEYEMFPAADGGWVITSPPYRDLIGHVTGSVVELHALHAKGAFSISPGQLDHITHCMLAHHGRLEWRSPVEPQTPEAWVLHAADMMSARCLPQQPNANEVRRG